MVRRTLLLAGHGIAGHRLVEALRDRDRAGEWRVVAAAEEARPAYNRVALSSYLDGKSEDDLSLVQHELLQDEAVDVLLESPVRAIDRNQRRAVLRGGREQHYDALVLATGSAPVVPPVPGNDLAGCFVFRTLDDAEAIRRASAEGRTGVVIGGGLLGLEAANALRLLGMHAHVVESAPHLMPAQLDAAGAERLRRSVAALGLRVHLGTAARTIRGDSAGRVRSVTLQGGTSLRADVVIFAAGVRPRDELADSARLPRGEHGGFLVDERCNTGDPRVWAIGECAAVLGRWYGLADPGRSMADAVADQLTGTDARAFPGPDLSTRLKIYGVDVATAGQTHPDPGTVEITAATDTTYGKLLLDPAERVLRGAVLVGDTAAYPEVRSTVGRPLRISPDRLLRNR